MFVRYKVMPLSAMELMQQSVSVNLLSCAVHQLLDLLIRMTPHLTYFQSSLYFCECNLSSLCPARSSWLFVCVSCCALS